jgi:hypothetical protein
MCNPPPLNPNSNINPRRDRERKTDDKKTFEIISVDGSDQNVLDHNR